MERFGESFRNGKTTVICPLCFSHPDSQSESFKCNALQMKIKIRGKYEDLFNDVELYPDLINTITQISETRKIVLNF